MWKPQNEILFKNYFNICFIVAIPMFCKGMYQEKQPN